MRHIRKKLDLVLRVPGRDLECMKKGKIVGFAPTGRMAVAVVG